MKQLFIRVDNFFHFDRIKKWALTLILIGGVIFIYELVRIGDAIADASRAIQKQAESQTYSKEFAEYTAQKKAEIDGIVKDVSASVTNVKDLTANTKDDLHQNLVSLNAVTNEAQGLVADMRRETLPRIDSGIDTLDSSISQFSSDTHAQQERVGKLIDDNTLNVAKATTSFANSMDNADKTTAKLYAYVSDQKVQEFIDTAVSTGKKIVLKIDKITGNIEVMTADGKVITANASAISIDAANTSHDASTFIHGKLTAKPGWWQKYILTPLREVGGSAYLSLKLYNLANR
jgi:archaellum component FlaC